MENNSATEPQNKSVMPNNYMVLAIISTIIGTIGAFCFGLAFGGLGIYFASLVKPKWEQGDVEGANQAAKRAQLYSYIALALGIIFLVIQLVYRDEFLSNYQEYMRQLQNAD